MIIDALNLFSDEQAITADAASTNIIDTQPQATTGYVTTGRSAVTILRDAGIGQDLKVFGYVGTVFATIVTLTISLQTDADVAFGSAVTLWTTPAIPLATLVAGYRFKFPPVISPTERYLRLFYDVSTSATTGTITAGLCLVDQNNPPA